MSNEYYVLARSLEHAFELCKGLRYGNHDVMYELDLSSPKCGVGTDLKRIPQKKIQAVVDLINERKQRQEHVRKTGALSLKKIQETRAAILYQPEGRMYKAQQKWLKHCTGPSKMSKESKKLLVEFAQELGIQGISLQSKKREVCDALNRYYSREEELPEISRGSSGEYEFEDEGSRKITEFTKIFRLNVSRQKRYLICLVNNLDCRDSDSLAASRMIAKYFARDIEKTTSKTQLDELVDKITRDAVKLHEKISLRRKLLEKVSQRKMFEKTSSRSKSMPSKRSRSRSRSQSGSD